MYIETLNWKPASFDPAQDRDNADLNWGQLLALPDVR